MPGSLSVVHRRCAGAWLATLAALAGCSRQEPPGAMGEEEPAPSIVVAGSTAPTRTSAVPQASTAAFTPPREGEMPIGPEYEVAAEGAPLVAAIARPVWIYDGPETSFKRLGYLNPGMILRRAEQPVVRTPRCRGGWYRVAPRGFLCMNSEVTSDLMHPVVVAYSKQARRGEPLPYLYGRVRNHLAVRYAKAPSLQEQRRTEGDKLDEHLSGVSRLNQIRITGPPSPLPPFLAGGQFLPKAKNVTHQGRVGPHRGFGAAHSSFAFFEVYEVHNRLFGLSTDLDLVPLDRLTLASPSKIHGGPIADLPAGIVQKGPTPRFRFEGDRPMQDGMLDAYETVALTGNSRNEFLELLGGGWVHSKALYVVPKRTSWPGFLKEGDERKWIDVSLREQTLVAYEGRRAVYVTRVSTGVGGEGDPETSHATIKGMYRIQSKHVTATMSGDRAEGSDYLLSDVPYVLYFHHDYALHAAYWHEKFGTPRSHGCVNLAPLDAAWLFEWTDPPVPPEWHGIEANGEGTLVFTH